LDQQKLTLIPTSSWLLRDIKADQFKIEGYSRSDDSSAEGGYQQWKGDPQK